MRGYRLRVKFRGRENIRRNPDRRINGVIAAGRHVIVRIVLGGIVGHERAVRMVWQREYSAFGWGSLQWPKSF